MTNYFLNGQLFRDSYSNVFYAKGMVLETKIFGFHVNVYEYDDNKNITSLKVCDGITPYSLLPYIFGKPADKKQEPCSMFILESFTSFVAENYITRAEANEYFDQLKKEFNAQIEQLKK